jgi:hypothetical protein
MSMNPQADQWRGIDPGGIDSAAAQILGAVVIAEPRTTTQQTSTGLAICDTCARHTGLRPRTTRTAPPTRRPCFFCGLDAQPAVVRFQPRASSRPTDR